ncbi:hypothetical protein ENUP19_0347G0015 [Entamoeba nuttalli]|uniref:Uncharacterized protein n=2 Tax=Entamoeba nuttalli TaxID=412467 RepID=K2GYP1_ENTNP|nr:hypothetical protein ENU1_145940 [Entamoeba nuttalli P19]EKE38962.1 hypothetical protein ENU1_145940 [Entamoeba nuttalli P19]|eukprot:XP_008858699.1 hypothetical protein ENU1_145940 [Entamoeba nuttalli P19]
MKKSVGGHCFKRNKKENRPYYYYQEGNEVGIIVGLLNVNGYDVILKWKGVSDGKSYCFDDFEEIRGMHQIRQKDILEVYKKKLKEIHNTMDESEIKKRVSYLMMKMICEWVNEEMRNELHITLKQSRLFGIKSIEINKTAIENELTRAFGIAIRKLLSKHIISEAIQYKDGDNLSPSHLIKKYNPQIMKLFKQIKERTLININENEEDNSDTVIDDRN